MASDVTQGHVVTAAFSDGSSAATTDVQVRLAHEGITFHASAIPLTVWPYSTLACAEPISSHSDDVLLSSTEQPDATLFIANPNFVQRLAERALGLTTYATRKRAAVPWLLASLAVIAIGVALWAADLSPARAVASLLPDAARQKMGQNIIIGLSKKSKACTSPDGDRALAEIKRRLLERTGATEDFSIVVLDWNIVNAFAVPGEQIVLTRRILEKASGGDEIAGVIAHEIGHGLELHPETGVVRAMGMAAAVQFLLGGGNSNLANLGLLMAQLSYSRDAEHEADAHAVQLLREANISINGIKGFFERMNAKDASKTGSLTHSITFLRSHPITKERLKRFGDAPTYNATPVLTSVEWNALKTICRKSKSKTNSEPK